MTRAPSRRDFVRIAATSAAALTAFGGGACAAPASGPARRRPAPNNRLQLAIIGFGVRGRELYGGFLDDDGVEIVAVADVADARAKEGVRRIDERRGYSVCRQVADWRAIVGDPTIDAVIVATPDHWHAEPAIAAALAGKHVYCEKPLSLSIAEGRAIASAARAGGIRFQTGSQQRSEYEHRFVRAAEAVRNGRIGELACVTIGVGAPPVPCDLPAEPIPDGIDWDGWLGQAPWRPFHRELCPIGMHDHYPAWRRYREYANGGLADMGAHHFDIAQWALGMDDSGPCEVLPPAGAQQTGLRLRYGTGIEMVHGGPTDCTFTGSEGTIEVSRGHLRAFRGTDRNGRDAPELLAEPTGNELQLPRNRSHIADFLEAIRQGREPICTAEIGHRTATVCQLCVIGYAVGRPLTWDPAAERFRGANAAAGNALLASPVRKHG